MTDNAVFQSTFPQGERPRTRPMSGCIQRFQSTFPQGERRSLATVDALTIRISIHVPTRGTTKDNGICFIFAIYFNPRSHKGNDEDRLASLGSAMDFNPRSHKGNDVHMPAIKEDICNFNPRSHKGNDHILCM